MFGVSLNTAAIRRQGHSDTKIRPPCVVIVMPPMCSLLELLLIWDVSYLPTDLCLSKTT